MSSLYSRSFWESYYSQFPVSTELRDWYLPHQVVEHTLKQSAVWNHNKQQQQQQEQQQSIHTNNNGTDVWNSCQGKSKNHTCPMILHIGCGSSELPMLLHARGLHRILNIDFSSRVIEDMQTWLTSQQQQLDTATSSPSFDGLSFEVMDVRALEIETSSIDLILDKGTLDCVVLEKDDTTRSTLGDVHHMMCELSRVLVPGGHIYCFSLFPPTLRFPCFTYGAWKDTETDTTKEEQRPDDTHPVSDDSLPRRPCRTYTTSSVTYGWDIVCHEIDFTPYELPLQQFTYLYIATKHTIQQQQHQQQQQQAHDTNQS